MNITNASALENRILSSALEELRRVQPNLIAKRISLQHKNLRPFDGEIALQTGSTMLKYLLEIKVHPRPEAISHLIVQKNSDPKAKNTPLLLIADYINPNIAARLKDTGINYLDTAGNLFLKREPMLYLHVEGKKPVQRFNELRTRLFQPSGLMLLFGLLANPESVNRSYREMAEDNGVALGTVGWVMRDLREQRFLERSGKDQVRLIRKKELLDQWVQAYTQVLRPKILIGRFGSLAPHLEDVVVALRKYSEETHMKWALSGGFAADELLRHYRGQRLAFYASDWTITTPRELPIVPVGEGDISVLRGFSPLVFTAPPRNTEHPVCHPLLIYAELLYQGTDRDIETAQLLYKNFLEDSLAPN